MKRKQNDGDYLPGNKKNGGREKKVSSDSGELSSSDEEFNSNMEFKHALEQKKVYSANNKSAKKPASKQKNEPEFEDWDISNDELQILNLKPPSQDLIKDESDRIRLSEMTEREREEELFRRAEEMEIAATRKKISESLLKSKKINDNSNMDSIKAADLVEDWDDDPLPYKSKESENQRPFKVSELFGDVANEDEKWDEQPPTEENTTEPEDEEIKSIDQIESIRISRFKLEKWLHMPFFNKRIPGFFVRINIGCYKNNNVYRVAQIVGIKEQESIYNINLSRTNKVIRLRHCNQERNFRMEFVSNQPFLPCEYAKWVQEHKNANQSLPRMSEIKEKLEDLEYCKNYHLSDADITLVVKEKQKFNQTPINYSMTKKTLTSEIEQAQNQNNTEKVAELKKKLDNVIEQANIFYAKQNERDKKIRDLHEKNRLKELEERERMIEEEMKADKTKEDDPFTRRRTKPTLLRFSRSATLKPEVKQEILDLKSKKLSSTIKEESATPVKLPEANNDPVLTDLHKLHDFEIDIDIDSLV